MKLNQKRKVQLIQNKILIKVDNKYQKIYKDVLKHHIKFKIF